MKVGSGNGYDDVFELIEERDKATGSKIFAAVPKLADDEKIVATFPEILFKIRGGYAGSFERGEGGYRDSSGSVYGFNPYARPGTLFVTTRRIMFIRRKWGWKDGYLAFRRAISIGALDEVERALLCGGIEYFDIPLEEIKGQRSTVLGGYLWISAGDVRYRVHLGRKELACIRELTSGRAETAQ